MNNNQFGRSMVEMLGVLAIIGVLSVGAIAGYSKAMFKYKLNKFINEQTYLINGLIQHDSLRDLSPAPNGSQVFLTTYIKKLELVPIKTETLINQYLLYDFVTIQPYVRNSNYVIDYKLKNSDRTPVNVEFCTELLTNLAIPFKNILHLVHLYRGDNNPERDGGSFYGDTTCTQDKTCLKDITQTHIHDLCSKCMEDYSCALVFSF